ncbi:MAG: DUF5677 domain-containing protein [Rickettsiales bacterium]|nr:DUF5677 domain-containing protein [Rickettsiales bacterium]MDG4546281.1 DUF5677 domain-containing protein [Rickettsiales bacterium]MDG4548349.1 DUF5677 domain-containing protein [Rickettsiales bacterium]
MKRVLVLCTGNSCRSIMAEGLINKIGEGRYKAVSAGSNPVGYVHPKSIETLQRHGIDIIEPRSKSWDEFANEHFDLVITVCDAAAAESCPVFLGKHEKLHWSTPDPAKATGTDEEVDAAFDEAFEMLKERVENMVRAEIAKKHLSNLIEATKLMLQKHTSFPKDDLAGRMITYFIFKQLDHAMSVIKLDPSMDAGLVSRTMIEGVINLSWALEKSSERVRNWFDYSAVYDFKLLEQQNSSGSFVSEKDKTEVNENYEQNAHTFLTKNGNKHHDNFRKGKSLRDIIQGNVSLEGFYSNYQYFSDWAHWGSQSLRHAIIESVEDISYYESEHVYRVPALVIAFVSLLDIAVKTNEHFKLKHVEALEEISNKMFEDLKKTGMQFND